MTPIKKALILSLGIHMVVLFWGGKFLGGIRLKHKRVIYPIHLVEIREPVSKTEVKPPVKKKRETKPAPPKPAPKTIKKKAPKKTPEPQKGIPLKKKADKKTVDTEPEEKGVKQDIQKKEEEKKVSQAIEEIRNALAHRTKAYDNKPSKDFIDRQLQIYAVDVDRRIKDNWSIPKAFLKDMGDLEAIVVLRLKPNGELIDARIEKPSGFHPFDESTLRAIKKAAPFPMPPFDLKEDLEIEIGFYSDQIG